MLAWFRHLRHTLARALNPFRRATPPAPAALRRGRLGETAAREYLSRQGLAFLAANVASARGELDLVFRDGDCLVFVEVKTRSSSKWTRPASAVDRRKRRALTRAAHDYLRQLRNPRVKYRFDIVEVLLEDDQVREVRHITRAFNEPDPFAAREPRPPRDREYCRRH